MKIITDYPNYRIYRDGTVESNFKFKTNRPCEVWRKVKQVFDKSCGYMIVTLCDGKGRRQNKRVHRLMCEAYLPNPENKPHVNHLDGNKLNNTLPNFEWATAQENAKHAVNLGLCDERRKAQELPILQYTKDWTFVAEHFSLHEAERNTAIAYQNIYKVCKGKRHTAGGFRWKYK